MQDIPLAPMFIKETWFHTANVAAHVLFGTLALLISIVQLAARKGGAAHGRRGTLFMKCLYVVVGSAAIGVLVYRFNAVLAIVTLLVGMWGFSGQRALRLRDNQPTLLDASVSLCGLAASGLFVLALASVRFNWNPTVVYASLGTLATLSTYDLARFAFPRRWLKSLWLHEHMVKMIGAHGALLSTFAGTVLPFWQPYSQLIPSSLGMLMSVYFVIRYRGSAQGRYAASQPTAA